MYKQLIICASLLDGIHVVWMGILPEHPVNRARRMTGRLFFTLFSGSSVAICSGQHQPVGTQDSSLHAPFL